MSTSHESGSLLGRPQPAERCCRLEKRGLASTPGSWSRRADRRVRLRRRGAIGAGVVVWVLVVSGISRSLRCHVGSGIGGKSERIGILPTLLGSDHSASWRVDGQPDGVLIRVR